MPDDSDSRLTPADASLSDPGTTTLHGLVAMDNDRWVKLIDQYFARVYQWCLQAGLDEHSAADVAQEVFIAALGSLHRFTRGNESTFAGWLRRISQRRIVDHQRAHQVRAIGGETSFDDLHQITSIRRHIGLADAGNLNNRRLLAAIAVAQTEFEATTWQAFWMTTVDERSATDVAFELAITRNAVYVAKSRVLKRLRKVLDKG